MNYEVAKIAKDTCVDVAINPNGSVGCIMAISSRKGIRGATVSVGNPLAYEDSGWYPLTDLELCGETAEKVVARYL